VKDLDWLTESLLLKEDAELSRMEDKAEAQEVIENEDAESKGLLLDETDHSEDEDLEKRPKKTVRLRNFEEESKGF
jgi:hypothetical protein